MKTSLLLFSVFLSASLFGQLYGTREGDIYDPIAGVFKKEFNKQNTEYLAKTYISTKVLTPTSEPQKFHIEALSAAASGELTCLYYECGSQNGLVFGFWGKKVNPNGLYVNQYEFTHMEGEKALKLLEDLQDIAELHHDYLMKEPIKNNIIVHLEEFDFIIYLNLSETFRVMWNGFDADWKNSEYDKTKKRLKKALNIED